MKRVDWKWLVTAAALSFSVPACGGDDVECGANTELRDGECIAVGGGGNDAGNNNNDAGNNDTGNNDTGNNDTGNNGGTNIMCGQGTILVGDVCVVDDNETPCEAGTVRINGECVPLLECGEGTVANESGVCIPAGDITCGDGTTLEDGACIPDPEAICAEGTTFDATTGRCAPDVVCGGGTMAVEGECLSPGEIRQRNADITEGTEANDPAFGGTAETVMLPEISNTTVIAGGFEAPVDLNSDGLLDQDRDAYAFEATAGVYVQLQVLSNGAGSLGFMVEGPNDYIRYSPSTTAEPARKLLLPFDGTYTVTVAPQSAFADRGTLVGGDDAQYTLALENRGALDPAGATALDSSMGESGEGQLSELDDNLFTINAAAGAPTTVTLSDVGNDAQPALIVLSGNGMNVRSAIQSPDFGGTPVTTDLENDTLVLVDYVRIDGVRDAFTLTAETFAPTIIADPLEGNLLSENDFSDDPIDIPNRQSIFIDFTVALANNLDNQPVPQGLIIQASLGLGDDEQDVAIKIVDPNGDVIAENTSDFIQFHATVAGEYSMQITNPAPRFPQLLGALNFLPFVPVVSAMDVTASNGVVYPIGDLDPESDNFYEQASFLIADITEQSLTSWSATQMGTDGDLALIAFDPDLNDLGGVAAESPSLDAVLVDSPGTYYGLVLPFGGFFNPAQFAAGVEVTVTGQPYPTFEVEPNNDQTIATPIAAIEEAIYGRIDAGQASDFDFYSYTPTSAEFRVALVEALNGTNDTDGENEVVVEIRDANGAIVASGDTGDVSGAVAFLQANQQYFFVVYSDSTSEELLYTLSFFSEDADATIEVEPNDTSAEATTASLVVMPAPSIRMAGTLVGAGDVDWFTFTIPTDARYTFFTTGIAGLVGTGPTLDFTVYQDDAMTEVNTEGVVNLAAGTYFLRANNGLSSGLANNYRFVAAAVPTIDLGVVASGTPVVDTGTLTGPVREFNFELLNDIQPNQALVVGSDTPFEIIDESGNVIFTGADEGGFFGIPAFESTNAIAGNYEVLFEGEAGEDYRLFVAVLNTTIEEGETTTGTSNGVLGDAQEIGTLAPGESFYLFGSGSAVDLDDFYSFTLSAPADVVIEQYQLTDDISGEDRDLALIDGASTISNADPAPHIFSESLQAQTYSLRSRTYNGAINPRYLLRISAQ